jgi:hypothetical protein
MKSRIITTLFIQLLRRVATQRVPDVIIGGADDPYLYRWFVIPRNPIFNIYLHKFLRSDDDRALHDHPWVNCSVLLDGQYTEHTIGAGGIHHLALRQAGEIKMRWTGRFAHRIELTHGSCWTLFITGPRYRQWGFHCEKSGWVHWEKFTSQNDHGAIGKGCDQ